MTGTFREIEHCWIPMADGVRLSARLWLPESGPTPAIVEYIPYRKRDMVRARDERNHPWFAARGYACLRVDMRGSGDSEGHMPDMYDDNELADALAVLEWISNQDWCDGAVGMMGTSWGGTSALQAAASGTGLLKAAIAVCATDNRYADDIHHMGGCLLTDSIEWGATLPAILALPPAEQSDPAGWRANWCERLEQMTFPLFDWIEHETRDGYWRHGAVSETPGRFDCPVLAIGGWADRYSNTVMNLLRDNPGKSWGIVGPWGHHFPDQGTPGPAIGFQQQALRWWDRWLRGENNGVEQDPRLRVWCHDFQAPADFIGMRGGHWRALDDWAEAAANQDYSEFDLRLRADNDSPGLTAIPFDLQVGGDAGDTGYFGRPGGLPLDQANDDSRSLVFETDVLTQPYLLLGKAIVELDLKTRQLPAQLVIRLCDVAPDGQVARVTWRVHNLALDDDYQPLDAASRQSMTRQRLALPNAAWTFAPGHRVRVSLSASYWPQIWPPSAPHAPTIDCRSARLRLALAPEQAVTLDPAALAESHTPVERNPLSIGERIRRTTEIENDRVIYRWHQPFAISRHDGVDIEIGAETTATHRIDPGDPLSASSRCQHELTAIHGNRRFVTLGIAEVTADAGSYHVEGSLKVEEDGTEVFSRHWSRTIPRKHA